MPAAPGRLQAALLALLLPCPARPQLVEDDDPTWGPIIHDGASNANTTDRERWDFHAYNTPIGPRIAFLGITYRNGTDPDGALMQEDLVKDNPDTCRLDPRLFIGITGKSSRDGVAKLDTFEFFPDTMSLRINYTASIVGAGPGSSRVALLLSYVLGVAHRMIQTKTPGFGNKTTNGQSCKTKACMDQLIYYQELVWQPCLTRSLKIFVLESKELYPVSNMRINMPYEGIQLHIQPHADKSNREGSAAGIEIAVEDLMSSDDAAQAPWNKFGGKSPSEIPSWCKSFDLAANNYAAGMPTAAPTTMHNSSNSSNTTPAPTLTPAPTETPTTAPTVAALPGLLAECHINPAVRFGCPFHHMSLSVLNERESRMDVNRRRGKQVGMGNAGFGFYEVHTETTNKNREATLTREELAKIAQRPSNFEASEKLGYEAAFMSTDATHLSASRFPAGVTTDRSSAMPHSTAYWDEKGNLISGTPL